jgi:hypothetical protein
VPLGLLKLLWGFRWKEAVTSLFVVLGKNRIHTSGNKQRRSKCHPDLWIDFWDWWGRGVGGSQTRLKVLEDENVCNITCNAAGASFSSWSSVLLVWARMDRFRWIATQKDLKREANQINTCLRAHSVFHSRWSFILVIPISWRKAWEWAWDTTTEMIVWIWILE